MRFSRGRWARWGWLATTLALGAALLATAWVGRERAIAASSTLNRGQGEVLLEAMRQAIRASPDLPDASALDSLRRLHEQAGVRYLALFDTSASLLAQAGQSTAGEPHPPADLGPRPPALEEIGGRLRVFAFVMPARPPEPRPLEGRRGARPRPPMLEIEFEPVVAERLEAEATRIFALSALVAATLLAAAFGFWRLSALQELTERRLEQQRRLGVLGEMSAVLAHEIRNPLASLKGHAQLLSERLGSGTQDGRKAELVVKEAQRLEALTADLLDFARSGPIDIRPSDPAALLRSCAEEVGPGVVVLHADGSPRSWPLDESRMRQALTNVLRNARQASPEGTGPEVRVGQEADALVFTVRDYGPGIEPGDEKRIFSPFFTTRTSGTGLGLTVALRIAELHGGSIVARNHPEGGAEFRITIPRTAGPA
jgi:two-component system sensor histidine kinase HydH